MVMAVYMFPAVSLHIVQMEQLRDMNLNHETFMSGDELKEDAVMNIAKWQHN